VAYLSREEVQQRVAEEVAAQLKPLQAMLPGIEMDTDIASIVAKTSQLVIEQTIDMPRILVVPTGEVQSGYHTFELDLSSFNDQAPPEELWVQHLRTHKREILAVGSGGIEEARLEDYVVSGLIDFDNVSYDDHSDLLYGLAGKVVLHFQSYLGEADTRKVLRCYQRPIANRVHLQMQAAFWERASGYEVKVSKGFTQLKDCAFTGSAADGIRDFRQSPADESKMARYVFGGFERCLYPALKFQSNTERKMAIILDRESIKWFKPANGQFQIYYLDNGEQREYQPDFVAETESIIYMVEAKQADRINDIDVLAKRDAAVRWCRRATDHALEHGGKSWQYVLVPHDAVAENMTIQGLADRFLVTSVEPLEEHKSQRKT